MSAGVSRTRKGTLFESAVTRQARRLKIYVCNPESCVSKVECHPGAVPQDGLNSDRACTGLVRSRESVIAPHQGCGRGSVERHRSLRRLYRTAPRVADEYLYLAAPAHDFDVVIADHAELAAVTRLVICVRLCVSAATCQL